MQEDAAGGNAKTLPVSLDLPVTGSPLDAGVTVDPVGTGKR
ncbi:hypothetical protein [Streptomyces sp. NPDC006552]